MKFIFKLLALSLALCIFSAHADYTYQDFVNAAGQRNAELCLKINQEIDKTTLTSEQKINIRAIVARINTEAKAKLQAETGFMQITPEQFQEIQKTFPQKQSWKTYVLSKFPSKTALLKTVGVVGAGLVLFMLDNKLGKGWIKQAFGKFFSGAKVVGGYVTKNVVTAYNKLPALRKQQPTSFFGYLQKGLLRAK